MSLQLEPKKKNTLIHLILLDTVTSSSCLYTSGLVKPSLTKTLLSADEADILDSLVLVPGTCKDHKVWGPLILADVCHEG